MSSDIERIKGQHKATRDLIHSVARIPGDIVEMNGARPGQVGLHGPLIDEGGGVWRLMPNDCIQFCGRLANDD